MEIFSDKYYFYVEEELTDKLSLRATFLKDDIEIKSRYISEDDERPYYQLEEIRIPDGEITFVDEYGYSFGDSTKFKNQHKRLYKEFMEDAKFTVSNYIGENYEEYL